LIRVRTLHHCDFQRWLDPGGEGTISSEDRAAWDFKVSRPGEIRHLKKHQIVPIEGKKGTDFGTTG